MLDGQGYLKLIDMGVAQKLEPSNPRTFTCIGTPHYMAPEVMRCKGYGIEADVWSLGVMFFEFVCGYLPFADELDDTAAVYTAVLKDALAFPRGYKDGQGRNLIEGMLTKQPRKRLGAGASGYDDLKSHEFFSLGHSEGSTLFDKIMGRELEAPIGPDDAACNRDDDDDDDFSDAEDFFQYRRTL